MPTPKDPPLILPYREAPAVKDAPAPRTPALGPTAFGWAGRGMWAICVAVYLTVFIGGIQSGGDELVSLGRALGFTLVAAVLGKIGLGLIGGATVPAEAVPLDDEDGPLGPHSDIPADTNVGEQEDDAEAA